MQAKIRATAEPGRTFTETARRAQIVRAAIATIAELGYRNASFAQIAKRAGLSSTGLISYHFEGREELIQQVVEEVVGAIGAHMAAAMADCGSATEALRTYIVANVEFIGAHREEMKALLEIFLNGGFEYDPATEQQVLSHVRDILRSGQRERRVPPVRPSGDGHADPAGSGRASVPARGRPAARCPVVWHRGRHGLSAGHEGGGGGLSG